MRHQRRKSRRLVDIRGFEVMAKPCQTCPFKTNLLEQKEQEYYLARIVTFQSQHLCHTSGDKKICRGGREIMLRALTAIGLIDEPTDEAFERKSKEVLG